MSRLANDPRAFVRPSPSGGQLGGVSRGTFLSIKLCECKMKFEESLFIFASGRVRCRAGRECGSWPVRD